MFKKIKAQKFQINTDHFFTTIPTWYFEMYNINIGLRFTNDLDAQGRVVYYSDSATILVTINYDHSDNTIIHEAVHVKQYLQEHWNVVFDTETEAILVSKLALFIDDEYKKHIKTKKTKKKQSTKEKKNEH
jgi:hypothetical protein